MSRVSNAVGSAYETFPLFVPTYHEFKQDGVAAYIFITITTPIYEDIDPAFALAAGCR